MSSSPDVNTLAALTHIGNIILFRAPTQDEEKSRAGASPVVQLATPQSCHGALCSCPTFDCLISNWGHFPYRSLPPMAPPSGPEPFHIFCNLSTAAL